MKKKNKITLLIMLLAAASVFVQSCGKDNVDPPSSTLTGRFTYQGQQVGLLFSNPDIIGANNTGHALALQQVSGAQNKYSVGEIQLYAKHDGSFTGQFYDGEYVARTLTLKNPFEDIAPNTAKPIVVKGNTNLGNFEVVPYWWMSNFQTTFVNNVFTATFNVAKVSTMTARTLQYVAIYLSPNNTPDIQSATQGAIRTFNAGTNSGGNVVPAATSTGGAVTVKIDLSTLTASEKAFLAAMGNNGNIWASVAVKTTGVSDALYSDAIMLK